LRAVGVDISAVVRGHCTHLHPQPQVTASPLLMWVDASGGRANMAWSNTSTSATSLLVVASVVASNVSQARYNVAAGLAQGRVALLARSRMWWGNYWPQSFVSLPVTRLEGYYYTQMYRFPAADRVDLMVPCAAAHPFATIRLFALGHDRFAVYELSCRPAQEKCVLYVSIIIRTFELSRVMFCHRDAP